jgi:hypothetical protein
MVNLCKLSELAEKKRPMVYHTNYTARRKNQKQKREKGWERGRKEKKIATALTHKESQNALPFRPSCRLTSHAMRTCENEETEM